MRLHVAAVVFGLILVVAFPLFIVRHWDHSEKKNRFLLQRQRNDIGEKHFVFPIIIQRSRVCLDDVNFKLVIS